MDLGSALSGLARGHRPPPAPYLPPRSFRVPARIAGFACDWPI